MSFDELVAQVDRAALSAFGERLPVTYAPLVGAPVQPTGIFDAQYVLAKGSGEAGVEATAPAVFFRLEDLPEDPQGVGAEPTITIRGDAYRVIENRPDGMGGIVLVLRLKT